jgi:hypothetical protein
VLIGVVGVGLGVAVSVPSAGGVPVDTGSVLAGGAIVDVACVEGRVGLERGVSCAGRVTRPSDVVVGGRVCGVGVGALQAKMLAISPTQTRIIGACHLSLISVSYEPEVLL